MRSKTLILFTCPKPSQSDIFFYFFWQVYKKFLSPPSKEMPNSFSRRVVVWSSWVTYQTLKSICQTRHRRDNLGHPKQSSCRLRQVEGTYCKLGDWIPQITGPSKMSFPEQERGFFVPLVRRQFWKCAAFWII